MGGFGSGGARTGAGRKSEGAIAHGKSPKILNYFSVNQPVSLPSQVTETNTSVDSEPIAARNLSEVDTMQVEPEVSVTQLEGTQILHPNNSTPTDEGDNIEASDDADTPENLNSLGNLSHDLITIQQKVSNDKTPPSIGETKRVLRESLFWVLQPNHIAQTDFQYYITPKLFCWVPELVFGSNFKCPNEGCDNRLKLNGWPSDPPARRVIALDGFYYVTSRRYRCIECEKKNKVQFSWLGYDQRLLMQLPKYIVDLFPCYLTAKSGLDLQVVRLMRELVTFGVQFSALSNTIKAMQEEAYHEKLLQFALHIKKVKKLKPNIIQKIGEIEESVFNVHGPGPSANYLKFVYLKQFELRSKYLNAFQQLVGGRCLSFDDSFKFPKGVHLVNKIVQKGERDVHSIRPTPCLMTCTNEDNLIVTQALLPSGCHTDKKPILQRLNKRYEDRGLPKPVVCWDDKPGSSNSLYVEAFGDDTALVERENEEYVVSQQLGSMQLPESGEIEITIVSTIEKYREAKRTILRDATANNVTMLPVGLDAEWNMGSAGDRVDLIQMCYLAKETYYAYLFQTSTVRLNTVSEHLREILEHPNVTFVGHKVSGDLERVAQYFRWKDCTTQCIEVAKLAKEKGLIAKANISLADMVEKFLKKNLPKPTNIRVSANWSNRVLTDDQQEYAALDAFASLEVYTAIAAADSLVKRLDTSADVAHDTQVLLHTNRNGSHPVAVGSIVALDPGNSVHGTQITSARCCVKLASVLVPGVKLDFGSTADVGTLGDVLQGDGLLVWYAKKLSVFNETVWKEVSAAKTPREDPTKLAKGDPFHIISQRLTIRTHHPFASWFQFLIVNAMFRWQDKDVYDKLCNHIDSNGGSSDDVLRFNISYFTKRCRRALYPRDIMYVKLKSVFDYFLKKKDGNGKILFTGNFETKIQTILTEVEQGWYEDPMGVDLYREIGQDEHGFTLYRCFRGTNSTENVHMHLISKLSVGFYSYSPETADALLADLRHRYNFNVMTKKKLIPRVHHCLSWLVEQLQVVFSDVLERDFYVGYPATRHFRSTGEKFGIIPIKCGRVPIIEVSRKDVGKSIAFLGDRFLKQPVDSTKVRLPPLPIHTPAEKKIFNELISAHQRTGIESDPNWAESTEKFNAIVSERFMDSQDHPKLASKLFPKFESHLSTYYTTYQRIHARRDAYAKHKKALKAIYKAVLNDTGAGSQPVTDGTGCLHYFEPRELDTSDGEEKDDGLDELPVCLEIGNGSVTIPRKSTVFREEVPREYHRAKRRGTDKAPRAKRTCRSCCRTKCDAAKCPGKNNREKCECDHDDKSNE